MTSAIAIIVYTLHSTSSAADCWCWVG